MEKCDRWRKVEKGGGGAEFGYLLCKTGNSTIEVQTVLSM